MQTVHKIRNSKKLTILSTLNCIDEADLAKKEVCRQVEPNLLLLTKGEKNARVAKNKDCEAVHFLIDCISRSTICCSHSLIWGGIDLKGGKGGECAYSSVRREK